MRCSGAGRVATEQRGPLMGQCSGSLCSGRKGWTGRRRGEWAVAKANTAFKTNHLAQLVLLRHSHCSSGTATVVVAQLIVQQHCMCVAAAKRLQCCSGAACAVQRKGASAQPVLKRHCPCCSDCTARVATERPVFTAAKPVLQRRSPYCSSTDCTATVLVTQPFCSSAARVAMSQPVLQHKSGLQQRSLCCCGTDCK